MRDQYQLYGVQNDDGAHDFHAQSATLDALSALSSVSWLVMSCPVNACRLSISSKPIWSGPPKCSGAGIGIALDPCWVSKMSPAGIQRRTSRKTGRPFESRHGIRIIRGEPSHVQ